MATSDEGRRLTEQHRLEQQAIRSGFLAEFIAVWALLDSSRLDETSPGWIAAVTRLVRDYRIRSARSSVTYFTGYRRAELPRAAAVFEVPQIVVPPHVAPRPVQPAQTPRRADRADRSPRGEERSPQRRQARVEFGDALDELDRINRKPRRQTRIVMPDLDFTREDRAVRVSLEVTGPVAQKDKIRRGKLVRVARDESFTHAAGAASRHVLTGGRQSLLTLVEADTKALGWARVTDGDPCAFCAMLASRGPVYTSQAQAGFQAHDNCACTAEPVYSPSAPWPGRAREFQKLWNEHIRGKYSGKDARNAWRRLYEQQQRDQRRSQVA